MKNIYQIILSFLFLSGCTLYSSVAQDNASKRLNLFNLNSSLALQGYDPVSYFDHKPQKGNTYIRYSYEGVTYRFISAENLTKFKQNPAKYEPSYGGWCAYAMGAKGEKVEVDPETYKILNDKLYLFYNSFFNNTLNDWNKNEVYLQKKADVNWNELISKP